MTAAPEAQAHGAVAEALGSKPPKPGPGSCVEAGSADGNGQRRQGPGLGVRVTSPPDSTAPHTDWARPGPQRCLPAAGAGPQAGCHAHPASRAGSGFGPAALRKRCRSELLRARTAGLGPYRPFCVKKTFAL